MMPVGLVNMSVFQLLGGRLAQPNHFDIELQLIACQGMIEVQGHIFAFDGIYPRITGLT